MIEFILFQIIIKKYAIQVLKIYNKDKNKYFLELHSDRDLYFLGKFHNTIVIFHAQYLSLIHAENAKYPNQRLFCSNPEFPAIRIAFFVTLLSVTSFFIQYLHTLYSLPYGKLITVKGCLFVHSIFQNSIWASTTFTHDGISE